MSELTVNLLRFGLLLAIWLFIFAMLRALRMDLYGTRFVTRSAGGAVNTPLPRPVAAPRQEAAHLLVTSGPLAGTRLPLRGSGLLIGRSPDSTLVLEDDFASGRHARIIDIDGAWWIEDLGSTNGTFVGEQRVIEALPLRPGDPIRIGRTTMELA